MNSCDRIVIFCRVGMIEKSVCAVRLYSVFGFIPCPFCIFNHLIASCNSGSSAAISGACRYLTLNDDNCHKPQLHYLLHSCKYVLHVS